VITACKGTILVPYKGGTGLDYSFQSRTYHDAPSKRLEDYERRKDGAHYTMRLPWGHKLIEYKEGKK
jgi:hypothetical protein